MEKAVQEAQATQEDTANANQAVSHAALSAAWDKEMNAKSTEEEEPEKEEANKESGDVKQEEPPKEAEEEPQPEEPEEDLSHGEKSRLGRKLKKLLDSDKRKSSEIQALTTAIATLKGSIETMVKMGTQTPAEPEDPGGVVTFQDLQAALNKQKEEQAKEDRVKEAQREEYETKYVAEMLKSFDADDVDDMKELTGDKAELYSLLVGRDSEFNQMRTGNPTWDFQLNLKSAELHLLKSKQGAKKPQIRQEEAKGTGVAGDTKEVEKADKTVDVDKLSNEAQDFLKHVRRSGGDTDALLKRTFG